MLSKGLVFTVCLLLSLQVCSASMSVSELREYEGPFTKKIPLSCNLEHFKNFVEPEYQAEVHQVVTEDGYKLQLFRIQKKGTEFKNGLPVAFFQHGLGGTGTDFIQNGPGKSIPYFLVDAGFDVWFGNNRGTKYAREHVNGQADTKAYWNFSFQDLAEQDLPSNIKKIREVTGVDKLTYIGHSQGCAQMFAALSDPAVKDKVAPYLHSFVALAPAVYLANSKAYEKWKMSFKDLGRLIRILGIKHEELGKCDFEEYKVPEIKEKCSKEQCSYDHFTDPIDSTMNYERYGYAFNSRPSGLSMKSKLHFGQLIEEDSSDEVFQKFDYGSKTANRQHYGQDTPPAYDLSQITAKVRIHAGQEDTLTSILDTRKIPGALKNADVTFTEHPELGHIAFMLAKKMGDIGKDIVAQIIKDMQA